MIPGFGIISAYGGYTPEYYNALGFFELRKSSSTTMDVSANDSYLVWGVFNLFFLIASLSLCV